MTDAVHEFTDRQSLAAGLVEARLNVLLRDSGEAVPSRLSQAMRHATLGGGKRFRAFLVLESARLQGAPEQAAVDVAAALECVHAYSLVHDDLPAMDNDTLRRGKPTVWKAYDEWTAILAGDALLTLAFEILSAQTSLSADARLRLTSRLARDAGRAGMVGGQVLDLEAEKLGLPHAPTLEHIRRLQAMKTGALIMFAAEAGALMTGKVGQQADALRTYGEALGLAFQISDDLIDAEGDATEVGKAVGKDAGLGKATLVSLMGIKAARGELDRVVKAAIQALDVFGSEGKTLQDAAIAMIGRRK